MLLTALADANTVLQACQVLLGTSALERCYEGDTVFTDTFNSNTHKLMEVISSLTSLHPALEHTDGMDWSLERDDYLARKRLIDLENPQIGASLQFPTPFSLLRTFPPAPADSAQWSASFFTNCCPVRPQLRVRRGLLRMYGDGVVHKHENKKVITPEPPAVGASAEDVAAYVCQAESQLGPLLHAVAPVAAAITQRPWPWVGGGLRSFTLHAQL
jgi:hypothetical protein